MKFWSAKVGQIDVTSFVEKIRFLIGSQRVKPNCRQKAIHHLDIKIIFPLIFSINKFCPCNQSENARPNLRPSLRFRINVPVHTVATTKE